MSSFPVYRHFQLEQPPVLLDAQELYELRPTICPTGETISSAGFYDLACIPPFPFLWIEFLNTHEGDTLPSAIMVDSTGNPGEFTAVSVCIIDQRPQLFPVYSTLQFKEDGSLFHCDLRQNENRSTWDMRDPEFFQKKATHDMSLALLVGMMAHCKNVDLVERLPKRHEQREAKRRGMPILPYREVVITPTKKVYKDDEGKEARGAQGQKVMHIARGHFAHYTEERKLFGKYSGTFWVPAHVRGSAEKGLANQRYKVKAA